MKQWRNSPHKILAVIGLCLGITLLPTISGCEYGTPSPINHVIRALGDLQPLPSKTERELKRFGELFKQNAGANNNTEEYLKYFRFGFKRIRTNYVKPVDEVQLIDKAIEGLKQLNTKEKKDPRILIESALAAMTRSLDPHSAFLNAREFRESFVHTKGEFGGLGIEVTMQDGFVKVISPIEDTPAARVGLKSGDLIIAVDGDPIKGKSLAEAVLRMRGPPGHPIELLIRRTGRSDFALRLIRAVITVRAVRWRLIDRIAYIRVSRFSEKLQKGITQAFAQIRQEMGNDLKGVILDLRNNPGGLLEQSVVLADAFLNTGKIVSVRGRSASQQTSFEASDGDLAQGLPMIVLVNSGSASASEIVVSALKNQKRATVMGSRTFGKGSVQTIIPMPREGGLKLTTALYYGADGQTIQARGVLPDIFVEPRKKEKKLGKRESDLPGAIPMETNQRKAKAIPMVFRERCPIAYQPARAGSKKIEDKLLGCALGFFEAGSKENFLVSFGTQNEI